MVSFDAQFQFESNALFRFLVTFLNDPVSPLGKVPTSPSHSQSSPQSLGRTHVQHHSQAIFAWTNVEIALAGKKGL